MTKVDWAHKQEKAISWKSVCNKTMLKEMTETIIFATVKPSIKGQLNPHIVCQFLRICYFCAIFQSDFRKLNFLNLPFLFVSALIYTKLRAIINGKTSSGSKFDRIKLTTNKICIIN